MYKKFSNQKDYIQYLRNESAFFELLINHMDRDSETRGRLEKISDDFTELIERYENTVSKRLATFLLNKLVNGVNSVLSPVFSKKYK